MSKSKEEKKSTEQVKKQDREVSSEPKKTKKVKEVEVAKELVKDDVDVDVDEKFNKNTNKANLKFDVNTRRKWLNEHYHQFPIPDMKKENGKKIQEIDDGGQPKVYYVGIAGSQYALAAVEQVLCSYLINLGFQKAIKTTSGLYEINGAILSDVIRYDKEMNLIFGNILSYYDSTAKYFSQLMIGKPSEIYTYVEKYCVDNTCVQLTPDGLNFLMYIFQKNRVMLANSAYHIVRYAHKRQINGEAITSAVVIHYERAPELMDKIRKKLEAVRSTVEEAQKMEKADKEEKDKQDKKLEHKQVEKVTEKSSKVTKKNAEPKKTKGSKETSKDEDTEDDEEKKVIEKPSKVTKKIVESKKVKENKETSSEDEDEEAGEDDN